MMLPDEKQEATTATEETTQVETTEVSAPEQKPKTTEEVTEPKVEETKPVSVSKPFIGGRAQKRIHQLVEEKNRLSAELKEARESRPVGKSQPTKNDDRLDRLESMLITRDAESFAKSNGLDEDEIGVLASIAETNGLVDEETGLPKWDEALKHYNEIIEKKLSKKTTPAPNPGVAGGSPVNAVRSAGKDPLQMTDLELKQKAAEFFKTGKL